MLPDGSMQCVQKRVNATSERRFHLSKNATDNNENREVH